MLKKSTRMIATRLSLIHMRSQHGSDSTSQVERISIPSSNTIGITSLERISTLRITRLPFTRSWEMRPKDGLKVAMSTVSS